MLQLSAYSGEVWVAPCVAMQPKWGRGVLVWRIFWWGVCFNIDVKLSGCFWTNRGCNQNFQSSGPLLRCDTVTLRVSIIVTGHHLEIDVPLGNAVASVPRTP